MIRTTRSRLAQLQAATVITGFMIAVAFAAESANAQASFDVASIKTRVASSNVGEGSGRSSTKYTELKLMMSNVSLRECAQWAYGLNEFQVSAPSSLERDRYDIEAKSATPVSVAQLRLMLQDLLTKRFKMKVHQEEKMVPVYELTIAKGGTKLPAPKAEVDISPYHSRESLPRVIDGGFFFQDASLAEFAEKVSMLRGVEKPVLDKTGIAGVFDITLKGAADSIRYETGPSLFTIVQEQLGLKLVATKAPVNTLVIDSAAKPSEN